MIGHPMPKIWPIPKSPEIEWHKARSPDQSRAERRRPPQREKMNSRSKTSRFFNTKWQIDSLLESAQIKDYE